MTLTIVGYFYDLGKIGIAKIRSMTHQFLPQNFFNHQEMELSVSYVLRVGKHSIPLERTHVIMCNCGKVFYERNKGDHEFLTEADHAIREALKENSKF